MHFVRRVLDDARGVGKHNLEVVAVDDTEDAVAGGLRLGGDDGDFLANQLIHKG